MSLELPSVAEAPKDRAATWTLALLVFPLGVLIWAFSQYPGIIRHPSGQNYILSVAWGSLFKMAWVFYSLYLLPGVLILAKRFVPSSRVAAFSARRIFLSFVLGMVAHVVALFLQKYLHLVYRPVTVLACLAVAYGILYGLLGWLPAEILLSETSEPPRDGLERGIAVFLLLLGLILGLEMTLRGRGSSLSLSGDGYPHLINTLGTILDGPMPDGLPFYSTFILNIHPMAFHALLANLKTLTPGLLYIDLIRYFSILMVPIFLISMFHFFSFVARNRAVGAMAALASLFVSGGGLSLSIPIVYFPWYWSIAWCLSAGVFFILLKSELRFPSLSFAAGIVFGAGVLLHPFFAFRMGMILACFLPLELLRRGLVRQPLVPVLRAAGLFAAGLMLPVGTWLVPLLLKHPWEETYSYDFIVQNFASRAPDGVSYIKSMKGAGFHFRDLWIWSMQNAGLLPTLLAPLGLVAILRRLREPIAALLLGWIVAMASAILWAYLPNPYRYFEYFFYGLVALSAFGMGWALDSLTRTWHQVLLFLFLTLSLWGFGREFWPKYRLALSLYGRTSMTPLDVRTAESWTTRYFDSKQNGRLDQEFGSYRGYLWSRQKKVWDIYLQSKSPKPPNP